MNTDLYAQAEPFVLQVYKELDLPQVEERLRDIKKEIDLTNTYTHSKEELEHGVRMAWRNSNRCIGRLYWKSLILNDKRNVKHSKEIFKALEEHLGRATNNGKILPMITVFPPQRSDGTIPFRIWNKSLIRYAAHVQADGQLIGDPDQLIFTQYCKKLGWKGENTPFDVLPIVIEQTGKQPEWRNIHPDLVLEVALEHPDYGWIIDLHLKWHALPIIADMVLEIGGIRYPAAPFNGWYMVTEIGSRNLGDEKRFNQLPIIAEKMGLKNNKNHPFWKDKALVVLNEAVFYSFKKAGITLTDHHAASEQFMKFLQNEEKEGRSVNADWSWIVPPISGSSMKVFHHNYTNEVLSPNYFYNQSAWDDSKPDPTCPFHISNRS